MSNTPLRLSKLMAERGICSRREADHYIENGWVLVNGKVVDELGTKVDPDVDIKLTLQAKKKQEQRVTILLNKPLGVVSNLPEDGHPEAKELITPDRQDPQFDGPPLKREHLNKLAAAGRLDINSKGLLVFTQDGRIAKLLIGEDSPIEKEYLVRIDRQPSREQLEKLRFGLSLDGKPLKRAIVEQINDDQLRFVLREGKKRQIRRMCELVDIEILALKRVRIGKVKLGKLKEGYWRWLEPRESF